METKLNAAFTIRPAEARDLASIAAIETASLPWAARWSSDSYLPAPDGVRFACVAELEGRIVGFLMARLAVRELEILNLAVAPGARRSGVGRALVRAALEAAAAQGATGVFLEVRESNAAALAFYDRLGFAVTGRRHGYYREPDESAVLMSRALPPGL